MLPPAFSRFPNLIGWPGGVGISLLVSALVLNLTLSLTARGDIATLNQEIRQLTLQLRQPSNTPTAAEVRSQLNNFMASLPAHDQINDQLNTLHSLANRYHLSLKNSEYRPSPNKAGNIQQLRILIKTEGEYPDLRGFLREIPQLLPSLLIGQISLNRQKISVTRVETVIEFYLTYTQTDLKRS